MLTKMNCLIAQSGGPTTAINASLAGVIDQALKSSRIDKILGSINGIQGVLDDNLIDLTDIFHQNSNNLSELMNTPSMFLGSCRYKLSRYQDDTSMYQKIFQSLQEYNIKYFFYIGGNDSMDTVAKLSSYASLHNIEVNIIGIPKTIDNDLACIDHTPGYGSAAKYIASSILEIAHDAYIYKTKSVTIVEVMGRNAGWLTAAASLARTQYSSAPHLIYLPECVFNANAFVQNVNDLLKKQEHVIVAVSEGIKDDSGNYVSATTNAMDQFGHKALSGTGQYLKKLVEQEIGCKVRSIELSVLQRCASHITSKTDIDEAFTLGQEAFTLAMNNETGKMVTLTRTSSYPYIVEYSSADINSIANIEKCFPQEWITEAGNDITEDFIDYALPLIQGEVPVTYKNGIPSYMPVNHLLL